MVIVLRMDEAEAHYVFDLLRFDVSGRAVYGRPLVPCRLYDKLARRLGQRSQADFYGAIRGKEEGE